MTSVTIVGGRHLGCTLAHQLDEKYETVSFVDADRQAVVRANSAGVSAIDGNTTEIPILRKAGIEPGTIVILASEHDSANLLVSQLARTKFGARDIITLVNDPRNRAAFTECEIDVISAVDILASALASSVRRQRPSNWLGSERNRKPRRKV